MPWQEVSVMDQRREFVQLAMVEGVNRRELCRRFSISPETGYKWLRRWLAGEELGDRSRRPHESPARSDGEIETAVLGVRDAHPAWGARKIACCLARTREDVPAVSTVHEILRRHNRIHWSGGGSGKPYQRFEKPAPNLLWQMDFKGPVALTTGAKCHPLTIVDDHSRYALCIKACANEQSTVVQGQLESTLRCYGLPEAIFVDNGSPWGIQRDSPGPGWVCGCSSWASMCCTAGHIIRRAAARMSASIAHSTRKYSRSIASAILLSSSGLSIVGEQSTTLNVHMRRLSWESRRAAIDRAHGPCRIVFLRWSMMNTKPYASCRRQRTMSVSKDASGTCHRLSAAKVLPSDRAIRTVIMISASVRG